MKPDPTPLPAPPFSTDWAAVEKGLPLDALRQLAEWSGVAVKEFQEVVIPGRTLKHRRARKEAFSTDESDRLARIARMVRLAARVYGNAEEARAWLTTPGPRFKGKTPLAVLRTGAGEQAVQEFLIQLEEGYFA